MYVDLRSCSELAHPMQRQSLVALVRALFFPEMAELVPYLSGRITQRRCHWMLYMELKELHLLMILDDMKRMYRVDTLTMPMSLAEIEVTATDRLFVTSWLLHQLVHVTLPAPVRAVYKLAEHTRDINGRKLAEVRLPAPKPMNTSLVDPLFSALTVTFVA